MQKRVVLSQRGPAPKGPYSVARALGNLLFLSGQGPVDPITGEVATGSLDEQVKLTLAALTAVLEDAGSSLEKVLKITLYLDNMDNYSRVNAIYAESFKQAPPARTCVEVARLPFGIALEIDAIAYVS